MISLGLTPLDGVLRQRKMTNRDLAIELHVHQSQVSRWRNGHHKPVPGQQQTIAYILGVPRLDLWPVAELAEHKERA